MRQQEIEDEIWRCINEVRVGGRPLIELGNITAWFGPSPDLLDVDRAKYFETTGTPSLELYIIPDQHEQRFDVHVTRIGEWTTYERLQEKLITAVDAYLPQRIFVDGDKFLKTYHDNGLAGHYATYTDICQELKPKSILEIGVRAGYSAWAMLQAVPDANYAGIDADNETNGGVAGYYLHAKDMLCREFPKASIAIELGDSQRMVSLGRRFDLIHIDGAHNHDQALHDLELCAPHADWLIIDDTAQISTVRTAVIEFLDTHGFPAWRYETRNGIVLIDTRSANGDIPAHYSPDVFDQCDMEDARRIILQDNPYNGLTTDHRWVAETDWLMSRMLFPDGLLIDLGCGIGRLSGPLVQRGHPVLGVDIAAPMRANAERYVADGTFSAVSPAMFLTLAEHGLRAQGALAVWALQHMLADDLARMIPALWNALEPGAPLYTMDCFYRCVPVRMVGKFGWLQDGFDVEGLIRSEGFQLHTTEEMPEDIFPSGIASLKRWIRKRDKA